MAKQIKVPQPLSSGVAKAPVVMQMEALECGAACLTMVLGYYRKWVPLEQVRYDCGVSRDGSKAGNVLKAARSYGLEARGFRFDAPETLKQHGSFPCIIHWNFNHFVVLCGFKKDTAVLNDPGRGRCEVSMEEFDNSFTGICLQFAPGPGFEPSGKPKSMLRFAQTRLKGARTAIVLVVLTTIISSIAAILMPGFSRAFLDRLLTRQNPEWFWPFLALLAIVSFLQIFAEAMSTHYRLKLNGKMSVIGNAEYIWKVLRLPMNFFGQRMAGDIDMRRADNATAAETLVDVVAPLVINTCMMVLYLVVMLRYSLLLTVIGVASVALNLTVSTILARKRANITRIQMRDEGKLQGMTVSGIQMIETIKASGAENGFFEKWAGYQASVNTQTVRFSKVSEYLTMTTQIISGLADVAILMTGVFLCMQGKFTIGMIMAFQGVLVNFTAPAATLMTAGETLQEMGNQMERVEDVMQYPEDPVFAAPDHGEEDEYGKLSGKLELKDVTFGYSRLSPPLIQNFTLTLTPGSRVALVGSSGCGKSTITKLVSGLYQPWSGEILFDGKPMRQIDRSVFTGSLAVVDQDVILFEDTIANNIKMWDESIEDFEMILAARDAQLHSDIMKREGGYNYRLSEGGRDFSGGQRQRLEIARVLAQDPTIIILDEATSALDAKTEYEVVRSIKDRGITCIVVAHRLSTIRDCDEILVLDHGIVAERGTHEQLMALGGAYTRLVTSE